MSETFLSRWSRRKRAANTSPAEGANESTDRAASSIPPPQGEGGERSEPGGGAARSARQAESPPHPDASLPPVESIDAGTDVSAFLRPGVPAELTQAALRRAWVTDPAIRDFVGLAENAWDFNAPGGVPGFEPLRAIDDVQRLAALVTGVAPTTASEATGAEEAQKVPEQAAAPPESEAPPVDDDAARHDS